MMISNIYPHLLSQRQQCTKISWCENFMEAHSFLRFSDDPPDTQQKLRISTKFLHQEIRWNCVILCSEDLVPFEEG